MPFDPSAPTADTAKPVTTLARLLRLQQSLAREVEPVRDWAEVPLAGAVGRVLAQAPAGDAGTRLPAGVRIEPRHLAQLVAAGQATAKVYARARVGVVTLQEDAAPLGRRATGAAPMTAAMLAGAIEALGAQALPAACRRRCPAELARTIRMLARECALVLVAGLPGPRLGAALLRAMAEQGPATGLRTTHVRRIGTLQHGRLGHACVLAVSADPGRAAAAFATLVAPVIRRLQGRGPGPALPRLAGLADVEPPSAAPLLVREGRGAPWPGRLRLHRCAPAEPARMLAEADGVAWRPDDLPMPGAVAYFPFREGLA